MTDNTTPSAGEPSDAALEAQFLNYDPVHDVPSAVTVIGEPRILEPSIEAFSPDVQQRIRARLADAAPGSRDHLMRQYVREELTKASYTFRAMGGVGEGATETQRADAETANEIRLLQQEERRIRAALDEVRTVRDPLTGRDIPTEDKRIQGQRRAEMEERLANLGNQATLLAGPVGESRRREAVAADIQRTRRQLQTRAELEEAERRAEAMAAEERISRMAEAKFKHRRAQLD